METNEVRHGNRTFRLVRVRRSGMYRPACLCGWSSPHITNTEAAADAIYERHLDEVLPVHRATMEFQIDGDGNTLVCWACSCGFRSDFHRDGSVVMFQFIHHRK